MGHQYTVDEMKQNLLQLLPHWKQFSHSHITGMRIQHRWIIEGKSEWSDPRKGNCGQFKFMVQHTLWWRRLLDIKEDIEVLYF